jgi:hypothetical protein
MLGEKMLCQLHGPATGLDAGRCLAAVRVSSLPEPLHQDDHIIQRGYAVGDRGQWRFFSALGPAMTLRRAGPLSAEWTGHGTYEAALDLQFCLLHREDELVLLIGSRHPPRHATTDPVNKNSVPDR